MDADPADGVFDFTQKQRKFGNELDRHRTRRVRAASANVFLNDWSGAMRAIPYDVVDFGALACRPQ
jgi:hypothetical protein